jgi:hypothetical protein
VGKGAIVACLHELADGMFDCQAEGRYTGIHTVHDKIG